MSIYFEEINIAGFSKFIISYRKDLNFKNMQFSNDDFRKLIVADGFKSADQGFGFYFEKSINEPAMYDEDYQNKSNELRDYMTALAQLVDSLVIKLPVEEILCPICGFDVFDKAMIDSREFTTLRESKKGKHLRIIYCKKCRSPLIADK